VKQGKTDQDTETLMTADSENNVFGRTLNPNNINLTAGGSTGGEGALVALRGSILGIGTDIGNCIYSLLRLDFVDQALVAGSIRIPSIANGIYGFKPSIGVVPYSRQRRLSVPGVEGVKAVAGPMVTSIRDAQMFMKTIVQAQPWKYDSAVNRTVFQGLQVPAKDEVVIGYLENDGVFTPHPPVRRAIQEAVTKLESAGVKLVPITLPDISKMYAALFSFFRSAGAGVSICPTLIRCVLIMRHLAFEKYA
jgi:amidase